MSWSAPRCRGLPQPLETTVKSSGRPNRGDGDTRLAEPSLDQSSIPADVPEGVSNSMSPISTPRLVLPQPFETSSSYNDQRDMEDVGVGGDDHGERKGKANEPSAGDAKEAGGWRPSLPQRVESTCRSLRKSTPQPAEASATKEGVSESKGQTEDKAVKSPWRRFIPQPIETTKRHRAKQPPTEETTQSPPARKKFAPEPVETTIRRRRKDPPKEERASTSPSASVSPGSPAKNPRKFSPELLETARGSYRKVEGSQMLDQPSAAPAYLHSHFKPNHIQSSGSQQIHESRFSAANLAKKQTRQHSFLVPELPSIESDSSEENSDVPSLSTSPSASSNETHQKQGRQEIPQRPDRRFQQYMDSMAAQAAEAQLKEQVLAAYPNEQVYEPVDHFAVEQPEDGPLSGKLLGNNGIDPRTFRRESGADLDWHLQEMRRHHAKLADDKEEPKKDAITTVAGDERPPTRLEGKQKGDSTSPPMLGEHLVFPLSISPKMTRCDVDQVPVPRSHEHEETSPAAGEPKLWSANVNVRNGAGVGLWMGCCQKDEGNGRSMPTPKRTGLKTPAIEAGHSARPWGTHQVHDHEKGVQDSLQLPSTPSALSRDPFTQSVDKMLNEELDLEERIQEEFHDGFVTQIYNYLSLGYPSLAHQFDHELSKITQVSIDDLRRDDQQADANGYVGAPEGEGVDEDFMREGKCARWSALKAYVHEWARQQPDMADRLPDNWGVRARRGSWAI